VKSFIHPLSDCQSADIGEGTRVWQYCVILPGAKIGRNCNVCSHCFIENDVVVGDNVTIKCGVQIWDGMRIEDDVFIGPNATFCNDRHPVSGNSGNFTLEPVLIRKGAMIGAGAVILPGVTVGRNAVVGAGAVVVKDVPDDSVVTGVAAATAHRRSS
jgi:acetyltransferase-like isoleucine patch superfamily enzyme